MPEPARRRSYLGLGGSPLLPVVEIVDEEPPAALRRAAEEALADIAAGRSIVCMSDEAFDALLDELASPPRTS
jgi:hypothetical protein